MNFPSQVPQLPDIQDAIGTALDSIIAEHFQSRLTQLQASVDDLLVACEFDQSIEDQFPYGRLEFTKTQAEFIKTSLLNKDYFVISFNGGDTTAIRSALSTRVRGEVIQGGIEGVDIEARIVAYMEKRNFTVIDGKYIGVDAKLFLSQCKNIAEAGFRQLFKHTVKQHLQYLRRKAIEIKGKSALVIAGNTSEENKRSVLETSLIRGRHPYVKVSNDGRLEIAIDLFSAPIGHLKDSLISPLESYNNDIERNSYGEILLDDTSNVYPFIEHGNIPSFLRFYFGDTPFENHPDPIDGLVHWGNLDTEHGRFLSFFLDPKTDIAGLFDQCVRFISSDPEMGVEFLSDDRNDPDSHPSKLPGRLRFRVRSDEEKTEMQANEAARENTEKGAQVNQASVGDPAPTGRIIGFVKNLVGVFT